jgi:hypothetical protein
VTIRDPQPRLTAEHRKHLATSVLTDDTLARAGVYSEADRARAAKLVGRGPGKSPGPCIVFPVFRPGKTEPESHRVKPDNPRIGKNGKPVKYDQPGGGSLVYYPPRTRENGLRSTAPLYWCEGEKKGLLLDQTGVAVVTLTGVDNWSVKRTPEEKARGEARKLHPWIVEDVAIEDRDHVIVFDADCERKQGPQNARAHLAAALLAAGARSVVATDLSSDPSTKNGIDDIAHVVFERAIASGATESDALEAAHAHVRALLAATKPIALPADVTRVLDLPAFADAPLPPGLRWPGGYRVTNGEVWTDPDEEDGFPERVCLPVMPARALACVDDGKEQIELVLRRFGAWKTIAVERSTLKSTRAIVELSNQGLDVHQFTAPAVVAFLHAVELANETTFPRVATTSRLGWVGDGAGKTDATDFLCPDPIRGASPLVFNGDLNAVRGLGVGGEREKNEDVIRRALDICPQSATAIAAVLASPLQRAVVGKWTDSFIVHMQGDTSRGKSSMLKIAASVWGDSDFVMGFDATTFARAQMLLVRGGLPLVLDEVGTAKPHEIPAAIYTLANGQSRTQGTKYGTLKGTARFHSVTLTSGERALASEDTGPGGTRARVLTVNVSSFGDLDGPQVDALVDAASENYGHFGRAWVEALLRLDWSELKRELTILKQELQAGAVGVRSRHAASWALLILTERLARAMLGMPLDVSRVREAHDLAAAHTETRGVGELALERTGDWLAEHRSLFATLRIEGHRAGRPLWRLADAQFTREVFGYIAGNEVWILPDPLRRALVDAGFSYDVTLRLWSEAGTITPETSGGRRHSLGRRYIGVERKRVCVLRAADLGIGRDDDDDEDFDDRPPAVVVPIARPAPSVATPKPAPRPAPRTGPEPEIQPEAIRKTFANDFDRLFGDLPDARPDGAA